MKTVVLLAAIIAAAWCGPLRAADAKALYDEQCAKCHGADGKGDTKMGKRLGAKDYSDPKVQAALKDENGVKAVKDGLKDKDAKVLMKPSADISDADAQALIAYMRTFKK